MIISLLFEIILILVHIARWQIEDVQSTQDRTQFFVTDKQTDRQTDRKTDRQTDRQTERQKDRHDKGTLGLLVVNTLEVSSEYYLNTV